MANVSSFSGAMPVIPGGTVELSATTFAGGTINGTSADASSSSFATPWTATFVSDGSPVLVEVEAIRLAAGSNASGSAAFLTVFLDGVFQGRIMRADAPANTILGIGASGWLRVTPSAGSHTVEIKQFRVNTDGSMETGYLRVSKIVNQNDGLKPFWTPPIVTQLPSQATVGDQVLYAADATNGVYWQLQYDGLGTYPWKFIGGAPLTASAVGTYSSPATGSTSTFVNSGLSGSPTITAPLAGDYITRVNANAKTSNASPAPGVFISYASAAPGNWDSSDSLAGGGAATSYVLGAQKRGTVTAANQSIALVWTNANVGGTVSFYGIYMSATPIRVKAA
jgi:hypothetical protein